MSFFPLFTRRIYLIKLVAVRLDRELILSQFENESSC
jgi:hypothetical protein